MPTTALTDLPPELLDHITTYLPTANSLANLSRTNRALHIFIEKSAWRTFVDLRFPSLCPKTSSSWKLTARTLTGQSRAWERRAFVARYVEPRGDITTFPGKKKVERWKPPRGQTIGFTPHMDVYEQDGRGGGKKEVLAYSAGAEVCVRTREWRTGKNGKEKDKVSWRTYKPVTASEGRDDVTTVQLVRPQTGDSGVKIITGNANGDLQMLTLPDAAKEETEVDKVYFTTQGQPVRSSSLLQRDRQPGLLAAEVGDSKICLYSLENGQQKISPSSQIDIKGAARKNGDVLSKAYRPWSTNFLSGSQLAIGLGPSEEPIHIYTLTPSGGSSDHVRKFTLLSDMDDRTDEIAPGGVAKKPMSSVYPIIPLPSASATGSHQDTQVFLSGAYDGIVRLHDLRSPRDVEGTYSDPTDDSAIYSLLPRGHETLLVGSNRHNLLKIFDMRLGSKCYSYLDAQPVVRASTASDKPKRDWSLFLKPHSASANASNNSRGDWLSRRTAESSIYTLASPSPCSPHIYAGIENNVVELAFTDILDPNPDPAYFKPWRVGANGKGEHEWNGWRTKDVIDLACYEQRADMKLCTQRGMVETLRTKGEALSDAVPGLDRRWRVGGS
jgi:WD40 repeat protein